MFSGGSHTVDGWRKKTSIKFNAMADAKTNCSKCGGHIAFPKEMAGQEVACPHCNESVLLPKPKISMAWIMAVVFAAITVCLSAALLLAIRNKHETPKAQVAEAAGSRAALPKIDSQTVEKGGDDEAIKSLCKDFYTDISNQDGDGLRNLLTAVCRENLTKEDMTKFFNGNKYEFVSLDSVKYQDSALGLTALAKVKRSVQDSHSRVEEEGWRNLKLIKESSGWRIFSGEDMMAKMVNQFCESGLSDELKRNIELLRAADPFDVLDKNNTNAFEAIYKMDQGQAGAFPWNINFAIISNKISTIALDLDYSIRNTSENKWDSSLLEFDLKQDGKIVAKSNDLLPDLASGQQLERHTLFLLPNQPKETTKYILDVHYPVGLLGKSISLARNIPLEVEQKKASEIARLEIISTQFDLVTTDNDQSMLSARINYRIKNISADAIKDLKIKCVWYSVAGEQLDQTTEYVVGYGDVPLAVGIFKTGFIRCGKGYINLRVPVKVDVYVESDGNRSLVVKGFLIK